MSFAPPRDRRALLALASLAATGPRRPGQEGRRGTPGSRRASSKSGRCLPVWSRRGVSPPPLCRDFPRQGPSRAEAVQSLRCTSPRPADRLDSERPSALEERGKHSPWKASVALARRHIAIRSPPSPSRPDGEVARHLQLGQHRPPLATRRHGPARRTAALWRRAPMRRRLPPRRPSSWRPAPAGTGRRALGPECRRAAGARARALRPPSSGPSPSPSPRPRQTPRHRQPRPGATPLEARRGPRSRSSWAALANESALALAVATLAFGHDGPSSSAGGHFARQGARRLGRRRGLPRTTASCRSRAGTRARGLTSPRRPSAGLRRVTTAGSGLWRLEERVDGPRCQVTRPAA